MSCQKCDLNRIRKMINEKHARELREKEAAYMASIKQQEQEENKEEKPAKKTRTKKAE